jgi:ADP-ribose pyrophosphatase YjhB (NUDIX family)
MLVQHRAEWEGRQLIATWMPPPFRPPRRSTTQALGLCFTADRLIVLVSADGRSWTLPGGTIEPGETAAQTLRREVREEACTEVWHTVYLGCQRVDDPTNPTGPVHYYQTRFWTRVALGPFEPAFETVARRLVEPEHLLATLSWGHVSIAAVLLDAALAVENRSLDEN